VTTVGVVVPAAAAATAAGVGLVASVRW
jgi:hypothetical protein